MALMRCPECQQIIGDFPDVEPTEPDGKTAIDDGPCFDCVLTSLGDYDDVA
jgi:hypothetical protein